MQKSQKILPRQPPQTPPVRTADHGNVSYVPLSASVNVGYDDTYDLPPSREQEGNGEALYINEEKRLSRKYYLITRARYIILNTTRIITVYICSYKCQRCWLVTCDSTRVATRVTFLWLVTWLESRTSKTRDSTRTRPLDSDESRRVTLESLSYR